MNEMRTLNGYEIADGKLREEILHFRKISNDPTGEKYFDIDENGIISLKSPYRGRSANTTFPLSISDNGAGVDGSEINDLPKRIVLPSYIDGKTVTGFADGMFFENYAVEEIVFSGAVTAIPSWFCKNAKRLKKIEKTEHITDIGEYAFMNTRVEKVMLTSLVTAGNGVFDHCTLLHTVDIGNSLTIISDYMFRRAEKLSVFNGGNSIQTIGVEAFSDTHDLKKLPFLTNGNVALIDARAFFDSRIQFDWSSLVGCTLGEYATPIYDNTTDYWSRIIGNRYYTPCENRLVTLLHQKHPLWANELYADSEDPIGERGCALMTIMHIHSAFTGKKYTSPLEFIDEIRAKVTGTEYADVLNSMPDTRPERQRLLKALGYDITCYDANDLSDTTYPNDGEPLDEAAFKDILNSLANGAYVYISKSSIRSNTGQVTVNSGHAVFAYGVNEIGEVMIGDSSSRSSDAMVYEGITYQIPFQNITGPNSDIIIVRKK